MSVAKIALRNLSRQKRRSFLLGGAIAFGVFAATLVNGFTGGLILNLETNISKLVAGHIIISGMEKDEHNRSLNTMDDSPALKKVLASLPYPIAYTQKRTQIMGTVIFDSNSMGRTVEGVDWKNDAFLMKDLKLTEGSVDALMNDPLSALISSKSADKLGVKVGEQVFIQAQTVHGQQNFDTFNVRAIYDDTGATFSSSVFVGLESANKLVDMVPGAFNLFGITLKDFGQTDVATEAFAVALAKEGVRVMDRDKIRGKSFNDIFATFKKDKKDKGPVTLVGSVNDEMSGIKGQIMAVNAIALVVLVILLTVVMVGLTNTYRIIVFERSREIGTMRALGMQRPQVQRIFVYEAVFLSLGGAIVGILLASTFLTVLSLFTFGGKNDSALAFILNNGHLAWRYDFMTLVITTALVAGMTWLAALFPARRAGRIDPAVALRTTA